MPMSVFAAAVAFYTAHCEKSANGSPILGTLARDATAAMLHDRHVGWSDFFSLDDVESYVFRTAMTPPQIDLLDLRRRFTRVEG